MSKICGPVTKRLYIVWDFVAAVRYRSATSNKIPLPFLEYCGD